jgi:regulation of enolase protein 1 (concanavalin A-like superfamily)
MPDPVHLSGLPFPLDWQVEPASCTTSADGAVGITAWRQSDLFASPAGDEPKLGAARLVGRPPDGDFLLTAHVEAPFGDRFDAGALLVWVDEQHWAKLAVEWSPQQQPMVVSVVTDGRSDDANGTLLDRGESWLRIARVGPFYAFHSSRNGRHFHFVRQFALDGEAQVGLLSQSPVGDGCTATFRDLRFEQRTLQDLRDES